MSVPAVDAGAGDEVSQLWALLGELSSQLKINREAAAVLQSQADDLKGQLHHARTGYALRRFNVDVSKEVYSSELERLHVSLVRDNNTLSYENRQLMLLARDYHQTLEQVMTKFRAFCHATQSHVLNLTAHYERQLSAQSYHQAHDALYASTSSTATLEHLGTLVRRALRVAEGEDPDALSVAPLNAAAAGPASAGNATSSPLRMPSFYGSGGYFGKWHDPAADAADAALEYQVQQQQLLEENRVLRSLLGIAEEPPIFHAPPINTSADTLSGVDASATSHPASSKPHGGSQVDPAHDEDPSRSREPVPADIASLPPVGIVPGGLPGSEKLSLGLPRNKMRELQARELAADADGQDESGTTFHDAPQEATDINLDQSGQPHDIVDRELSPDRPDLHVSEEAGAWLDVQDDDMQEEASEASPGQAQEQRHLDGEQEDEDLQIPSAEGGVEAQVSNMLKDEGLEELDSPTVDASDPPLEPAPSTGTDITSPVSSQDLELEPEPSSPRNTISLAPEKHSDSTQASLLTSPRPEARPLPDPEPQHEATTGQPRAEAQSEAPQQGAEASSDVKQSLASPEGYTHNNDTADAEHLSHHETDVPANQVVSESQSHASELAEDKQSEGASPAEAEESRSPTLLSQDHTVPLSSPEPEPILSPVQSVHVSENESTSTTPPAVSSEVEVQGSNKGLQSHASSDNPSGEQITQSPTTRPTALSSSQAEVLPSSGSDAKLQKPLPLPSVSPSDSSVSSQQSERKQLALDADQAPPASPPAAEALSAPRSPLPSPPRDVVEAAGHVTSAGTKTELSTSKDSKVSGDSKVEPAESKGSVSPVSADSDEPWPARESSVSGSHFEGQPEADKEHLASSSTPDAGATSSTEANDQRLEVRELNLSDPGGTSDSSTYLPGAQEQAQLGSISHASTEASSTATRSVAEDWQPDQTISSSTSSSPNTSEGEGPETGSDTGSSPPPKPDAAGASTAPKPSGSGGKNNKNRKKRNKKK